MKRGTYFVLALRKKRIFRNLHRTCACNGSLKNLVPQSSPGMGEAKIAGRIDMAVGDKRSPAGTTDPAAQTFSKTAIPPGPHTSLTNLPKVLQERRLRRAMESIALKPLHSVPES